MSRSRTRPRHLAGSRSRAPRHLPKTRTQGWTRPVVAEVEPPDLLPWWGQPPAPVQHQAPLLAWTPHPDWLGVLARVAVPVVATVAGMVAGIILLLSIAVILTPARDDVHYRTQVPVAVQVQSTSLVQDQGQISLRTRLCPVEDSCRADWYDGAWHLERTP